MVFLSANKMDDLGHMIFNEYNVLVFQIELTFVPFSFFRDFYFYFQIHNKCSTPELSPAGSTCAKSSRKGSWQFNLHYT